MSSALQSFKILFSCENSAENSFASLINRARACCRAPNGIANGVRLSLEHPGRSVDAGFQLGNPFTLAVAQSSKSVNLKAAGFVF